MGRRVLSVHLSESVAPDIDSPVAHHAVNMFLFLFHHSHLGLLRGRQRALLVQPAADGAAFPLPHVALHQDAFPCVIVPLLES